MADTPRKSIGVRELRAKAGRVLRRVNEKRESVDVTYRGEVIARIIPVVRDVETDNSMSTVWDDIDRLAEEISRHWKSDGRSAAEVISEARR